MPNPRVSPYLPVVDQPGIREDHKRIADEVLRLLPPDCRGQIKNFYVHYDASLKGRGYASKSTVIMRGTLPANEFRAVLIHEVLGHVLDLGCLRGTIAGGESDFRDGAEVIFQNDPSRIFYEISWMRADIRKKGSRDADFASRYAAAGDPYEDVAEAVTLYVLQPETFRARAKTNPAMRRKLAWIETYAFPHLKDRHELARGATQWDGKTVAWDVTKLPYVWHSEERVAAR